MIKDALQKESDESKKNAAQTANNAAQTATTKGNEAVQIATTKGNEAVQIATTKGNEAISSVQPAVNTTVASAVDKIVQIKQNQSQLDSTNKIWIQPQSIEYVIPTMDDVATVAETITYLEITQ